MLRVGLTKGYFSSPLKHLLSCYKSEVGANVISYVSFDLLSLSNISPVGLLFHMKMSSFVKNAEKHEKDKSSKKFLSCEHKEKKITRSVTTEAEKNWKEYYLKLPLEEKRKEYSCGKKYVQLDEIESWSSYASKLNKKIQVRPLFDVNEELNMKISLWRGDITCLEIDVICNAANGSLLGGGGVDGAIHRAAGKKLYEECVKLNGCDTGSAKLTGGYKLPAKYILHTVGPIGEKPVALASCYKTCLDLAKKNNLRSVAFPCISTGIYGYDVEKATPVVMETVRNWLLSEDNGKSIDKIIFCVFLMKDVSVYQENLLQYFPVEDPIIETQEKKKPKSSDSSKSENKDPKEVSEKSENKEAKEQKESERKKLKIEESSKNKSKEQKEMFEKNENKEAREQKESDKKKLKIEDSSKNENKEMIAESKKPKTGDSSKSDIEEVKEQKVNKSEEKAVSDTAKDNSDILKKVKNRNKSKNESGKAVVQESYL